MEYHELSEAVAPVVAVVPAKVSLLEMNMASGSWYVTTDLENVCFCFFFHPS